MKEIEPIAFFHSPLPSKFGVPKQSGIVAELEGCIVFEPAYRDKDALRGMEDFGYLWLIWGFSANSHQTNTLMVRPPRLGGNKKVGVFASRSPFRPNALGVSSVRISSIDTESKDGPVIHVKGADLMDGTPIYDIKPYVTFVDSHADARSGFVDNNGWTKLKVEISEEIEKLLLEHLTVKQYQVLKAVLSEDPRPQYQKNPQKVYGMPFEKIDVHFRVIADVLIVEEILFDR